MRAGELLAGAQLGEHRLTSATVQRIHSQLGVLEALALTSAARTSWSVKIVPSSRSAGSSSSIV